MGLRHLIRRASSKLRESVKKVTRPSAVTRAQHVHVVANPSCAGCGSTRHCQGHHVKPYNKFPELAADPSNFVTACMDIAECHIRICHGDSFRMYNPNVLADLARALREPVDRPRVWAAAKAARLPDR